MYIPNLNLSCAPSGSALYLSPGYLAGRGCPVLSLPSQPQPSITTSRRILAAVLCHQALNFQRPPTFPLLPPLSFDLSLQPTFQLTLRPPVSPSTALTPPSTSSEPPASMSRRETSTTKADTPSISSHRPSTKEQECASSYSFASSSSPFLSSSFPFFNF